MSLSKLDKLVLVPFIGLFILTLCVAIFILLINFLLVFLDELLGKELGLLTYLQLLSYFGVSFTPTAFPLATLVASVITIGNLGESQALTVLKSAGISMLRVLLPLLVAVVLLSSFAFFLSNYLVPQVNSKAYALLFDLREKKPSIAIQEGVFYHGIPGYSIRVDKKLPDHKTLQGILVYDHTQERGNVAVTIAASGQLYTICNGQYLVLALFDGCSYLEESAKAAPKHRQRAIPSLTRSSFQVQKVVFDLASFRLTRSNPDIFSYHHTTKSTHQLNTEIAKIKANITAAQQRVVDVRQQQWIAAKQEELRDHEFEKYRRFASAVGCIIVFLIGAPLGALTQRGRLGVPLLISTVFILLYYVVEMLSAGWAKAGLASSLVGAWLANLLLLPFGVFLLRQAQQETHLLAAEA